MTLYQFIQAIGTCAPTGYTYYATDDRSTYNNENTVVDTVLVENPRDWPAMVRPVCNFDTTFSLWFGKGVVLATAQNGYMEHSPYQSLEIENGMQSDVNTMLQNINAHPNIQVLNIPVLRFLPEPTGQGSTNAQAWVTCSVQCRVWVDNTFDYEFDLNLQ